MLVTASNPDATLAVTSATTTLIPSAPPASTSVPTLTGAAQRGSVLTLSPGTWSGIGNSYAYTWQRSSDGGQSWSDVAGQTCPRTRSV